MVNRLYSVTYIFFIILGLTACNTFSNEFCQVDKRILIDLNESCFSEVKSDDDYVYYYCSISLKNNTDSSIEVQLLGDFAKEHSLGILAEKQGYAVLCEDKTPLQSLADEETLIEIPADSAEDYSVVFVMGKKAEYNGEVLKADRNLPDITIVE